MDWNAPHTHTLHIVYIIKHRSYLLHTSKYEPSDCNFAMHEMNCVMLFIQKLNCFDPRKSSWASTTLQLHKFSALVMPFCLFTFQNARTNACKLNAIVSRFILNLYFVIRMLHDDEWITNTALLILIFFSCLVWFEFQFDGNWAQLWK